MRRTQTVHVNASIVLELLGKFRGEFSVLARWEITQRIPQRELLLFGGQDVFAHRSVAPFWIALEGRWQDAWKTLLDSGLKFSLGHGDGFLVKRPVFLSNPYGQCLQPL